MPIVQTLLLILIALSGIPAGLLISKYTKEELKAGKKWFIALMILSAVLFLISALSDFSEQPLAMAVLGFIFLLALTSFRKAKI